MRALKFLAVSCAMSAATAAGAQELNCQVEINSTKCRALTSRCSKRCSKP
jgi:hypothetical protein